MEKISNASISDFLPAFTVAHMNTELKIKDQPLTRDIFRVIYDESPIGIELYNSRGELVDVNKACVKIFGIVDVEEVRGFRLFDDPNVTDDEKAKLRAGETVSYEAPFDFEKVKEKNLYRTTKSGTVYLDVLITPLISNANESGGYLVQVQDITNRQRAEDELRNYRDRLEALVEDRTLELAASNEALKKEIRERERVKAALEKSERNYRFLVDNIPAVIRASDVRGNTTFISPNVERIYGYTSEEICRRGADLWFGRIHPDDAGKVTASYALFFDGREPFDIEYRVRRKDGNWIWVHDTAFLRHTEGREKIAYGVFLEITAKKEAEKKLYDITSNLGVGVYVFDRSGTITFMNPMARHLWGWDLEELNKRKAHDLVHYLKPEGTPLPFEECNMHRVIKTGKPYISENEVFVRKDGTVFPVAIISTPLIDDGQVVGSVTAFRDITTEKKMEEELLKARKLESVGILAGGIAHDFNNLLQTIMGNISFARLLLSTHSPDKIASLLEQAEEASEAAKELSFRLLTFSKGGEPVKTLSSIERPLTKSCELSSGRPDISCEVDLPQGLYSVEIDEGQMVQVFNNILLNAVEAMPHGGKIRIGAANATISDRDPIPLQAGEYVCVSIQDTGSGISAENLSRIFDPYFSTKETGSQKGSGLGLAIALSIVKKHNGYITAESREGAGTTFRVYLPASAQKRADYGTAVPAVGRTSRKRLLCMDDNPMTRSTIGNMIAYLGFDVEYAKNGEEAVSAYRRALDGGVPFDAVILDLTVEGGMGGVEAARKLLETDPLAKIVISSGYADNPVIRDFRKYGFADSITKPFKIEELKTVLDALLRNKG